MYDDLTRINFKKMKAIGDDKGVDQCWSTNGQIKFKLVDQCWSINCQIKFKLVGSATVKTVKQVFDSIDNIIR